MSRKSSSRQSKLVADAQLSLPLQSKQSISSRSIYEQLDDLQKRAVDSAHQKKIAALLCDTGTGKTWITGGVIEKMWRPGFLGLIIVPLTNKETTWITFLKKYFTVYYTEDDIPVDMTSSPAILLLHYEEVPKVIKKLRKIKWSLIVYDEGHKLKARGSLASRRAAMLAPCAPCKLDLTATSMDKHPPDMWAQFRFLAPEVFGTRWADFENEFFEPIDFKIEAKPGSMQWRRQLQTLLILKRKRKFDWDKLPEFIRRIKPYVIRIVKDLDVDLKLHEVPVVLRGHQRQLYENVKAGRPTFEPITCPNKAVKLIKLHQICGGYVYDDDDQIWPTGRAKMRATKRLVKANPLPFVIFCTYRAEIEALYKELSPDYDIGIISGKNRKERAAIQTKFQKGGLDGLICQIRAGGVGLDLFYGCTGIIYSYNHSYIDFDQLLGRLHRRGQKNDVNFFLIFARYTVDEDRIERVVSKSLNIQRVLEPITETSDGKSKD